MKKLLIFLVLIALSAMTASAINSQVGFGDNVVTHFANGGGWATTIVVVNLSATKAAAFTLNFYADGGTPLQLPFIGVGTYSVLTSTLAPAGQVVIKTDASVAQATQGWAQFDSSTSTSISGFAIFSNSNGNEAVVPFESSIAQNQLLAFDNTGGFGMGVALVNSNSFSTITVNAIFCDQSGAIMGRDSLVLNPGQHTAFIFSQRWPFTANRVGTVYFDPTNFGLAILGLRFTPRGAFTSVHSLQQTD